MNQVPISLRPPNHLHQYQRHLPIPFPKSRSLKECFYLHRHLSNDKKLHWHIDYLLKNENSEISEILFNVSDEKIECELSQKISATGINDFGCSDCECMTHLYYFENKKEAIEKVTNAYDSIAMPFHDLKELRK